eukprot:CAMPEP_0176392612 /NCGR_PEP_ID=MMETSP0126-20121128/41012_1 /TAXON_ID=141414 ORGANISM="Strombidinopsis acuminatum, Strain SPMC142" /NCGR_SAMPLE_ID=MMETSP0126 /ASSEMBLY_ACC=CAM_ASM_000229 /LENGTH=82 /DNA_ID=CAMNT_0017763523 /DNA_START=1789 /DNA_END=2037 /DNA_ORIENTATION=-
MGGIMQRPSQNHSFNFGGKATSVNEGNSDTTPVPSFGRMSDRGDHETFSLKTQDDKDQIYKSAKTRSDEKFIIDKGRKKYSK